MNAQYYSTSNEHNRNCNCHLWCSLHETLAPTEEEVVIWMIASYALNNTISICNRLSQLPPTITTDKKRRDLEGQLPRDTPMDSAITVLLSSSMSSACKTIFRKTSPWSAIAPPTGTCIRCRHDLISSHVTRVNIYYTTGVVRADKYTLRCRNCSLMYRYV